MPIYLPVIIGVKLLNSGIYLIFGYVFVHLLHSELNVTRTYFAVVISIKLLENSINFSLALMLLQKFHHLHCGRNELRIIDHLRA